VQNPQDNVRHFAADQEFVPNSQISKNGHKKYFCGIYLIKNYENFFYNKKNVLYKNNNFFFQMLILF